MRLQDVYASKTNRGVKTPAEDEMVATYPHTTFDLNPRAPSIDTPLHAYIPHAHVDHMHPVAVIAIATAADGPALTREIYGDEVVWTDWQRPGFELGLELQRICQEHPQAKGRGHGRPRAHQLGRRRPPVLRAHPRPRPPRPGLPRRPRRRPARLRRRPDRAAGGRRAPGGAGRGPALAARPGVRRKADDRDGPGDGRGAGVRRLARRRPAGGAGHELPRPLSPHQDQAALRGLAAGRGHGRLEGQARRRAGAVRRGLPPVLPRPQARRLAGAPALVAVRRPDPGRGPDRVGQVQEREPGHGRVLHRRHRRHARRRAGVELHRAPAPGGVRHRVLALGGGQAPADAGREGARAPGGRRRRRRLRHRPRGRGPADRPGRRGRGRRPGRRDRSGSGRRGHGPDRDGHRRGRHRALGRGRRRRAGGRHDRPRRRPRHGLRRAAGLRRHRPRGRDRRLLPDAGRERHRRGQPVGDGVRRQRDRGRTSPSTRPSACGRPRGCRAPPSSRRA